MKNLKHSIRIIILFMIAFSPITISYGEETQDISPFLEDYKRQLDMESDLLKRLESRYDTLGGPQAERKEAEGGMPQAFDQGKDSNGIKKTEKKEDKAIEVSSLIKGLQITKRLHEYGIYLYSVKAKQVAMIDVLKQAAILNRADVSFEGVEPAILRTKVDVSLHDAPFNDVLEMVTGMFGLEFQVDKDGRVKVTLPSNMGFADPQEYLQSKAVQSFHKFQINYPDNKYIPESYFKLGDFFCSRGLNIVAIQEFSMVAERYPDHPLAKASLMKIGQCFEAIGDLERARSVYGEFIERYPFDDSLVEVYWAIANNWHKEKRYDMAISVYRKILEFYPLSALAVKSRERISSAYMENKEFSKAFEELIALKRDNVGEWGAEMDFMIGECLYYMERYDDAFVTFTSILRKERQEEGLLKKAALRLADCLYKTGRYLEAIHAYKRCTTISNDDEAAVYGLLAIGRCFRQLGLFDKAVEFMRAGLEDYPESKYREDIKYELARTLYDNKEYSYALKIFADLTANVEGELFVDSAFYEAECLFFRAEYKDAIEIYKKLLPLVDEGTDRFRHIERRLGRCYQNIGLLADALNAYQGKMENR